MDANERNKHRAFKWPQAARDAVRVNINAIGAELNRLITMISQETGNPRDACLDSRASLGLKQNARIADGQNESKTT